MPKNRETELQGTFCRDHIDKVKGIPAIKKRAIGRALSRRLVTVYFDTPDHELHRLGLSLQVRKVGRAFVQCVKQTYKRRGGIVVRTEWEGAVPSQDPAISMIKKKRVRRLIQRTGVERLQPVFRTDVQRSSRTLRFDEGSTASLDIDVGEIVAGSGSQVIREFDLELKGGEPGQLFDLALEIHKEVPFRLSTMSKASRGYALLAQDRPQAKKHAKLIFAENATIEQVLIELVQHCLDQLRANEEVVHTTDDAEGVHQMRVALRRLRAALRLFKLFLPKEQYGWAVAEAKWLTAELSAARAWDVFADEFLAPLVRLYPEDKGFDALVAAVEKARLQSRGRARDTIGMERYTEFLLRLRAWLSSQAWRDQSVTAGTTRFLEPIGDHCVKFLQDRDRSVRKQGREIANLSEPALHELRLAVKRLRYAVDFFECLYPKKRVKAYRKHLAALQDELGYLNDVAAAETLLRDLGSAEGDPAWAYSGGLTVGWHRHAAVATKQSLHRDMAAFIRTKPFWRGV